jgi:hypothetical protein
VSFEGQRKWFNRSPRNVPSLALAPPDGANWRKVWALNEKGTILPIDPQGKSAPELETPGRFLISLAEAADNPQRYAALAISSPGTQTAVGLDAHARETWHYRLPAGVHRKPIEPIASGPVVAGRANYWLLAGPDGTVHLLSSDGDVLDQFAVGSELTGIAAAQLQGEPAILVSTPQGVTAWRVTEKR